jgi:hypothetical protein
MSHPPGASDPDAPGDPAAWAPVDPWATPPYPQPLYPRPPYPQPGYGPGYGPPVYGPYPGYRPPTNVKALAALWSGVGLVVVSCCMLGIFGFIPVALGVKARNEIRASGGQQSGDGLALTGIACGILAMVLSLAVIALVVAAVLNAGSGFDTYGSTSV